MIQNNSLSFTGKPGKLPAKNDPRQLNLSNYINLVSIPEIPLQLDWTIKKTTPWGMMNNRALNNCTCAAAGHMIECWTCNAGNECIISDQDVMQSYIALSGYDPATGNNDNPICLADLLKYWRVNGIGKHMIKAYAGLDFKNHPLVMAGVYLFGGLYLGLNLPISIKGQDIWDVTREPLNGDSGPGTFGGHAVNVVAYDEKYVTVISWGKVQKMTWSFWDTYSDELYAIITEDFFNQKKTPVGLNRISLEADLMAVTGEKDILNNELNNNKILADQATTIAVDKKN